MVEHSLNFLLYSGALIISAWAGGIIALFFRNKTGAFHFLVSFGAGILLSAALLHLLPQAAGSLGEKAGLPVLLGFLLLYLMEKFMMTHPCPSGDCQIHRLDISALIGLSIHSLTTGLALGSGMKIPQLGMVVFLAVFLHKIPETLSLTVLLIKERWKTKTILMVILIFSLLVPIGALIVLIFYQSIDQIMLDYFIAFSAGIFLYIAVDDMMPEVHRGIRLRKTKLLFFSLGIGVMFLLKYLH